VAAAALPLSAKRALERRGQHRRHREPRLKLGAVAARIEVRPIRSSLRRWLASGSTVMRAGRGSCMAGARPVLFRPASRRGEGPRTTACDCVIVARHARL